MTRRCTWCNNEAIAVYPGFPGDPVREYHLCWGHVREEAEKTWQRLDRAIVEMASQPPPRHRAAQSRYINATARTAAQYIPTILRHCKEQAQRIADLECQIAELKAERNET